MDIKKMILPADLLAKTKRHIGDYQFIGDVVEQLCNRIQDLEIEKDKNMIHLEEMEEELQRQSEIVKTTIFAQAIHTIQEQGFKCDLIFKSK